MPRSYRLLTFVYLSFQLLNPNYIYDGEFELQTRSLNIVPGFSLSLQHTAGACLYQTHSHCTANISWLSARCAVEGAAGGGTCDAHLLPANFP